MEWVAQGGVAAVSVFRTPQAILAGSAVGPPTVHPGLVAVEQPIQAGAAHAPPGLRIAASAALAVGVLLATKVLAAPRATAILAAAVEVGLPQSHVPAAVAAVRGQAGPQ